MALGRYLKTSYERKRYSVDYYDWLDKDEKIFTVSFQVAPEGELEIDAWSIDPDGTRVIFFAAFGIDGASYVVNVRATTTGGQHKEDEVLFDVDDLQDVVVMPI